MFRAFLPLSSCCNAEALHTFMTIVLPPASAGPSFHACMSRGKFLCQQAPVILCHKNGSLHYTPAQHSKAKSKAPHVERSSLTRG